MVINIARFLDFCSVINQTMVKALCNGQFRNVVNEPICVIQLKVVLYTQLSMMCSLVGLFRTLDNWALQMNNMDISNYQHNLNLQNHGFWGSKWLHCCIYHSISLSGLKKDNKTTRTQKRQFQTSKSGLKPERKNISDQTILTNGYRQKSDGS